MRVILDEGALLPTTAHEDDGGFDLYSTEDCIIRAGYAATIDTGVHVEIPKGYVGMIKSRSGMNIRRDLVCEGVIDSGYTGSIVVKLRNESAVATQEIKKGDRIAQLVLLPVYKPALELVDRFIETERGNKGFGSSGR